VFLVGVSWISGNDVEFCDDRLPRLVCCWWVYVGLVVMMRNFVMAGLRDWSVVSGSTWD